MAGAFAVSVAQRIGRIEISREPVRNALRPGDFRALAGLLDAFDNDPEIGCIVLTGAGSRAFCAGLDLKDPAGLADELSGTGPTGLGTVLRRASRLGKPLIGRINGACVAGGMGLLAACDLAIASEDAVFGLPEIRSGLFPFVALAAWSQRFPATRLSHLAATGTPIGAAPALALGLVHEVTADAGLDSAIDAAYATLLSLSPAQMLLARQSVWTAASQAALDAAIGTAEQALRAFNRLAVDSQTTPPALPNPPQR